MFNSNYSKNAILLFLIVLILICNGCSYDKNISNLNIDNIKKSVEDYLIDKNYVIENTSYSENDFSIFATKDNKRINISYTNDNESQSSITFENAVKDYSKKYVNIDYQELFELSQIIKIEKISADVIKKACEDKRDCYDSINEDYYLPQEKIMSKIYRVGFFENPIIMYELSSGAEYTETVTILWNS